MSSDVAVLFKTDWPTELYRNLLEELPTAYFDFDVLRFLSFLFSPSIPNLNAR